MFYNGELQDGNIAGRPMDETLTKISRVRHRTIFFDMLYKGCKEKNHNPSYSNFQEADMTISIIKHIMEVAGGGKLEPLSGKIGIVTPYTG